MARYDYREKSENELTFYVYDNLRGQAMGSKEDKLYRYDSLSEAVAKFKELPSDWTTAIGCSFGGVNEIDLVHRVNGKPVKVTDYERIDVFACNPEVNKAMSYLEALLDIRKQLVSGIHPRRSVLCQIEPVGYIDDYFKDKVLAIPSGEQSVHLFASINEVFEEGSGWIGYRDFIRKHPNDSYTEPFTPSISRVNANYLDVPSGQTGQTDMSPTCFVNMVKKTKEYNLSMKHSKSPLKQRIEKADRHTSDRHAGEADSRVTDRDMRDR